MFSSDVLIKFRNTVSVFSDRNAFLINEIFYTYGEFWDRISIIRAGIRHVGIDCKVWGLAVHDDLDTYASIFALWMEGLAYVPLHPKQPLTRNLEIIEQAKVEKVLDSSLNSDYKESLVLVTKKFNESTRLTPLLNFPDEDLAYILFTSGSTGKPKGVEISRGNIDAFTAAFMQTGFEVSEFDRCLQCFDLTFDVSVQSFLIPLLHGACVYTIPHDQIKYSYAYGLLGDHELTFGIFAPSMIRFLRPYFNEINLPKLRYCILTAEASPVDLVLEWSYCIPNASIYNFYGPTEATIYCTYYPVPGIADIKQANGMLCIGKVFDGIKAVILDEILQEVPRYVKGEMYISGKQLTRGYWANPEKNDECFVTFEHNGLSERYYKTGDLCFQDDDDDIMYCGRMDYQVKIQGYRIELGEIEFNAREIIGGRNAIAYTFEGSSGNQEIALCLEIDSIDQDFFLKALKSKLPNYMIPSKIFHFTEFPLNTSGKIDRNFIKNKFS
jgi:amino acid adenylation domain-containing protein